MSLGFGKKPEMLEKLEKLKDGSSLERDSRLHARAFEGLKTFRTLRSVMDHALKSEDCIIFFATCFMKRVEI